MVKFIHTADWHLGIKHIKMSSCAEILRNIRCETLRSLPDVVRRENADFIIIAGDLFDSNEVGRKWVELCVEIFSTLPLEIYILPGNHDPLTRDSIYFNSKLNDISNVTILAQPSPLKLNKCNVTLYPCPVTQKKSSLDPTGWIPKISDDTVSIGVAHGNLQIHSSAVDNFPISPTCALEKNLDYLALGEWHSTLYKGLNNIAYSGTPETTKFDEENSGKILSVEIKNHGAQPVIREIEVGRIKWKQMRRQVYKRQDIDILDKELNAISSKKYMIVRLQLEGVLDYEDFNYVTILHEKYSSQFLYFEIEKKACSPKPDVQSLVSFLPDDIVYKKTVNALLALMKRDMNLRKYVEDVNEEEAAVVFSEIQKIHGIENIEPEILENSLLLLYQNAQQIINNTHKF